MCCISGSTTRGVKTFAWIQKITLGVVVQVFGCKPFVCPNFRKLNMVVVVVVTACFLHDSYSIVLLSYTLFMIIILIISELLDTFFIVIHKKKLIFLHWYHHISVLLFCWAAYAGNTPTGTWYCVMNYAVHAIMYFYYFLMAVRFKPKWFKPVWITVAQIMQMVVGVTITAVGCYILYVEKPDECWLNPRNNAAALVMYGSYLFLFVEFFLERYFIGASRRSPKKKKVV